MTIAPFPLKAPLPPAGAATAPVQLFAFHGVLGREVWLQRLQNALLRHAQLAVLLVDIDHLAESNDAWGVAAGDALIAALAQRLQECAGGECVPGHLGGGQFAVLLPQPGGLPAPTTLAASLLAVLRQTPVAFQDQMLALSASVGISCFPRHGRREAQLLSRAELALKHAKRSGGDVTHVYDSAYIRNARRRNALLTRLRQALARGDFRVAYQPIMGPDGLLQGAEALLRWTANGDSVPCMTDTLKLLEETGLITEVGHWLLQEACRQAADWRARRPDFRLHVNLSPVQLRYPQLLPQLRQILRDSGLPPAALHLEIPEEVLRSRDRATLSVLERLGDLGVRLWLDDFGAGYSPLAFLDRLPVNGIKIDRSFLSGMAHSPRRDLLLGTVATLGQALNLKTIADGVETPMQARLLDRLQISGQQGFLYGAATAARHFEEIFFN